MATVSIAGYTADLDYARIVHINYPRFKYVRSFKIIETQDRAVWTLTINQSVLVGQYPTQAAAIGALVGCIIHRDGDLEGAEAAITDMLSRGSTIDADVNIFTIEVTGSDPDQALGGTVSAVDYSVAPTAGEYWFAYQNSTDSGATWGVNGVASALIVGDRVTAAHGGSQTDTPSTTTYDAFAENSLMRGVLVERILTGDSGTATTSIHAPGAIWSANAAGLPATTWEITTLAGDAVSGVLTITFVDQAARDAFLANAEFIDLIDDLNPVLASDFAISTATSITATGGNAATVVSAVDALGAAATWNLSVVSYGTQNIVGYSQNTILKDDVDETDLSGLTMVISGDSTAGEPVVRGGYAYSVVDESGAVLDPGESISYTYAWYREIPTLTSLDSTQI